MTEHTKRRMRQTFDLTKGLAVLGSILLLMQQAVDLRGKVVAQEHSQTEVAATVAAHTSDIAKLSANDKKQDKAISRLERSPQHGTREARSGPASSHVATRSPGIGDVVGNVIALPFRLGSSLLRALAGK
jgi:hypothetical protein